MTEHDPQLANLAQEWARAITTTAYVPMSVDEIRRYLLDLTERLVEALSGPAVDTRAAADVGARLVIRDFTGPHSLSRTVGVLARSLPATVGSTAADPSVDRTLDLLCALITGYTGALRDRILDQQDEVKRALLHARQDVERDLQASEARFREVFDSSAVGIAISGIDQRITQTNPSLDEILGYRRGELRGRELSELFAPDDLPAMQERYQCLLTGQDSRFRVRLRLRRKDGETARAYLAVSVLLDAEQQPRHLATMVEDLTDLHLLEDRLNHQALHDVQTGLPNRQFFVSRLETVLGQLEQAAWITLLHLDLDGFSVVNDGLGLDIGDRVLDTVARRLEAVVADQNAMVARLRGDEFAILIQHGLVGHGEPAPDVGRVAEAINTELAEPIYFDNVGVAVTANIGVVQRQVAGTEPAELLRAADITLRRLRHKGKRQWASYDAHVDAVERPELQLAAAMPGALESGNLQVNYQPVVTLEGGRLASVEAALRWEHPQLDALSHERCAQLAEQTGVVHAVGLWWLHTAANQARAWRQGTVDAVPPLAVNLTSSQAQDPDLVGKVRAVLAQTELRPADLELRMPLPAMRTVTGVPAGEAGAEAEDNLRVLAEMGVRAALYDFACGAGELACLAELPVHAVRIAQPVARQVADDVTATPAQMLRAVVPMVRNAGISVLACEVDTEEQADWWHEVGADCVVGALFGQPGPPQFIGTMLGSPVPR